MAIEVRIPTILRQYTDGQKAVEGSGETIADLFNDLETRDEMQEVQIQTELLKAGVLTLAEVREMRGLPALVTPEVA